MGVLGESLIFELRSAEGSSVREVKRRSLIEQCRSVIRGMREAACDDSFSHRSCVSLLTCGNARR